MRRGPRSVATISARIASAISAGETAQEWWIRVGDTGPGLPVRAREHLFEAFQGSAREGGTGLGLAIAAELVRAHGGELTLVEGTIGATFRIAIPDRPVQLKSLRDARVRA